MKEAEDGKRVRSSLVRAHHNIATQIRNFLHDKLCRDMPRLADHLTGALKLDFPHFGYYPPTNTPAWEI
jgi:hypothetical protein